MTPETEDPPLIALPDVPGVPDEAGANAATVDVEVSDEVVRDLTFDQFFTEHRSSVLALVYSLSGSRAAAEDLTQEAFTAAFRQWDTIRRYESPGAWVRRVAMNKAVSSVRRRVSETKALARLAGRREPEVAGPEPSGQEFWSAVRALPTRQSQAVALYYLEDRSVAEIARILDRAEPTVRVHLHRGRIALAQRLRLDQQEEVR